MGIVAGLSAGVATLIARGEGVPARTWLPLGAAMAIAAVGLVDDFAKLGAWKRLAVQLAAAVALVAALGGFSQLPLPPPADFSLPRLAGLALAILWLVTVTNFFNFMDGIDGLAAGQALVTSGAILLVGGAADDVRPFLLLTVALAVFLGFNWAPARIFLGDVGSGFLGFLLAASPWMGPAERRERSVLLVAVSLALFLGDPLWTLARRWFRGARLTESHRQHLYQCLVRPGSNHGTVAFGLLVVAALLALCAAWSFGHDQRSWLALAIAGVAFLLEMQLVRRLGRAGGRRRQSSVAGDR